MLQKPGDNDGEANRKPALSFPRSPISPCITVTQMSNQASALNTEVPVSCLLSSPAPRLWLIVLPKRMISREHPFLEVMMQTWARGIKARAYYLYPFTREVSTPTASQLAYELYHKKEFVFSRNCNKMAQPSPVQWRALIFSSSQTQIFKCVGRGSTRSTLWFIIIHWWDTLRRWRGGKRFWVLWVIKKNNLYFYPFPTEMNQIITSFVEQFLRWLKLVGQR